MDTGVTEDLYLARPYREPLFLTKYTVLPVWNNKSKRGGTDGQPLLPSPSEEGRHNILVVDVNDRCFLRDEDLVSTSSST